MTVSRGEWASRRCFISVSWPYLWSRGADDPLGGFAFFLPRDDDDHNESLLHIWAEENLPHPKIGRQLDARRARQWVEQWQKTFTRRDQLIISAKKPADLDVLIDYAKRLNVNRLYLHTDTPGAAPIGSTTAIPCTSTGTSSSAVSRISRPS